MCHSKYRLKTLNIFFLSKIHCNFENTFMKSNVGNNYDFLPMQLKELSSSFSLNKIAHQSYKSLIWILLPQYLSRFK